MDTKRCEWAKSELMQAYHDTEWGVPVHDDRLLFEFLILEGTQAGLSWETVLKKRANYQAGFDQFDPQKIGAYNAKKVADFLKNPGLIRNRLKLSSVVDNARAFLDIQAEYGSFDRYIWQFVDHTPIQNARAALTDLPTATPESDAMSKALKKRGFRFVGSTICYAYMQAVGMVNDHITGCFRHSACLDLANASITPPGEG